MESRFVNTRKKTMTLCNPLETEDFVVQPHPDVSPPKWHLGHTTWFLEELILKIHDPQFKVYHPEYKKIFNSYYKGLGEHWVQKERGQLSRPLVNEIFHYRQSIDEQMKSLIQKKNDDIELKKIVELAINHEEQHQELLLMDIKYILAINPISVAYTSVTMDPRSQKKTNNWLSYSEGLYDIGASKDCFAYDNEGPRHKTYLQAFKMSEELVTNGEFLEFIKDRGYQRPELWLSKGFDWICENKIQSPLYWKKVEDQWFEFTLHGKIPLTEDLPVNHVSYFEADAYARWRGKRLPTEEEFEVVQREHKQLPTGEGLHGTNIKTFSSELWCWTKSQYSAYPGFRPFEGKIAEYNGKFMCNQFVLRGGCFATPNGHYRNSYRNFYEPGQRWMFSGMALAEDV